MVKNNLIAIIPARGNSKRIPGKNIKNFNGEPIIINTIKKLKKSKIFDKIIVSTDNKHIAQISKKYGAEVPFIRPNFLANDYASGTSVVAHCLKFLIKSKYKFKYACCVYAPNPFLKISDLKAGLKKIKLENFNYVFSATTYKFPVYRSFTFSNKKGIEVLFKKNIKKRSQELKEIICDAGQFYWGKKESWLKEKEIIAKNSDIVKIPESRYHDLDTMEDWKRAELSYQTLNKK